MYKKWLKLIGVQAGYVLLQFILSRINLWGFLSPAGLPFAILCLTSGGNIFVTTIAYFASKYFTFASLNGLFVTIYEVVFLALFYFALSFIKIKRKWLICLAFVLLSNVLGLYFSLSSLENLWHFAVNLLFELLLIMFFYRFFAACKNKLIFFKFSHADYLLFCGMTLLISLGLFQFPFVRGAARLFVLMFPVILLCKLLSAEKYFAITGTLGVGALLSTLCAENLIVVVVASLVLCEFKGLMKYVYAVLAAIIFAILAIIFKFYDVFSIISLVFAVLAYVALPDKLVSKLSLAMETDAQHMIMSNLENQRIQAIKSKLMLMSQTFLDMQRDFRLLVVGKISREKASIELSQDIINKCCTSCENYKSCFFGNINKRAMLENLVQKAIENSGANASDIPSGMQTYCSKSNVVLSEINQVAMAFAQYEVAMKTEDVSKIVIADELGNFADIFAGFSKNLGETLKVNERLSKALKEKLLANLIDAKEIVISESENGIKEVCAVLSNEQVSRKEVTDLVKNVTKNNMKLGQVRHLEWSGLSLATFLPLPRLRASFCVSSKAKENRNGDSTIVTKLSENKFFVAISDGMGHGEGANRISSMVLSLLRSMFAVGLDDTLILQSVNKLLLPAGLENFTTLDACVIDLERQVCNFIKLGSSVSVIKHSSTSELVSCASLPMGIVQNVKPTIIKKSITGGDMIFLASDGIVDSFAGVEEFKCFVNDSKIYNMQKYLDDVVSDAEAANSHIDDMTIIGINLLKN